MLSFARGFLIEREQAGKDFVVAMQPGAPVIAPAETVLSGARALARNCVQFMDKSLDKSGRKLF